MDTLNWAEKQNIFCDECFSMPLPNEDWERKTEHKASYALETNLKQSQDLRYCCVYKGIFINSKDKKYTQELVNYQVVKGIMSCLVTLKKEDYADVLSIITSFYNRYRKKTVVVIPPMFRQRQWNKFKEYHLSCFLTELGKRNIPFCETLDAGMLKKQGKYVIERAAGDGAARLPDGGRPHPQRLPVAVVLLRRPSPMPEKRVSSGVAANRVVG